MRAVARKQPAETALHSLRAYTEAEAIVNRLRERCRGRRPERVRWALAEAVRTDSPVRVHLWTPPGGPSHPTLAQIRHVNAAIDFVEPLLSERRGLPWSLNLSVEQDAGRERSLCLESRRGGLPSTRIVLGTKPRTDWTATLIHEVGHAVEQQKPGAAELARQFLEQRCRYRPLQEMDAATMPGEFGRAGFDAAFDYPRALYVGKVYESGDTEVISSGLQLLHADPGHFLEADPEFVRFLITVLRM